MELKIYFPKDKATFTFSSLKQMNEFRRKHVTEKDGIPILKNRGISLMEL